MGLLLCTLVLASNAHAARSANCSISTTPTPAVISAGGSVTFSGSVSGKTPYTYAWTFAGGSPSISSSQNVTVSYAAAGPYTAVLNGSNDKGDTCSASVDVTVNGGGNNTPPNAVDDAYSTAQDTPLSVPATGVLGNDSDADNDTITVADTRTNAPTSQNGSVTLNVDGSFDYTPAAGFSGDDSFTYVATDGTDTSNTATVTITVTAVGGNNPPVANNDAYSVGQDTQLNVPTPGVLGNDSDADNDPITVADTRTNASTSQNGSVTLNVNGSFAYTPAAGFTGSDSFTYVATDGTDTSNTATVTISVNAVSTGPTARGDTYATPVYNPNKAEPGLVVEASRVSGVLYNDFGGTPPLTAQLVSGPSNGTLQLNSDGSFSYTPNGTLADNANDSFTYIAVDSLGAESPPATVNINIMSDQPDYKIMMNYELGMHCTGFEFAYCCVLPPYNSILAQVVKPQATSNPNNGSDFPRLLEGSHSMGTDGLGRPTVVQAGALDGSGNYQTYMLEYFHDAQPRREGQGKPQVAGPVPAGYAGHEETLISAVEGNSMFYQSTIYDSAAPGPNNELVYGTDDTGNIDDVVQGDGDFNDLDRQLRQRLVEPFLYLR